jgi:hypothetical protein
MTPLRRYRPSRRALLRGALGGATLRLALPTLDAMLDDHGVAFADGTPLPRRYGIWFFGNGVKADRFFPSTTGTGWAVPPSLKPFEAAGVLPWLSVVSRSWTRDYGNNAHWKNERPVFSGALPTLAADGFPESYGGPRIDTVVTKAWDGLAPFKKLDVQISRSLSGAAFLGGDRTSSRYNPQAAFDRLFMGFTPSTANDTPPRPGALQVGQAAILDAVMADAAVLRARLGTRDRMRIDEHLSNVRELQRSMAALPASVTGACAPGARSAPRPPDSGDREPLQDINKAFADLIALALACDRTRVFELTYVPVQGGTLLWQVGQTKDYHGFGHDEPGAQPGVQQAIEFMMRELAYLAGKLKAVPVGAGNLLDQCLVWGTSEQNDPQSHGTFGVPTLLLGKAGGALKGGVHVRLHPADQPSSSASGNKDALHSRVHYTALSALGLPNTYYGEGNLRTSSVIPELLA